MYTEKDNKKVSILGTEYKIVFVENDHKILTAANADGVTDQSVKEIIVGYFEPEATSVQDLSAYQRKVIRHEIVHAFMYESGLGENSGRVDAWATNEEMIDWIARQHGKLHAAFEKAGAL